MGQLGDLFPFACCWMCAEVLLLLAQVLEVEHSSNLPFTYSLQLKEASLKFIFVLAVFFPTKFC